MDKAQLLRDKSQCLLSVNREEQKKQEKQEKQEKLVHTKVLIVGVGGLGSPVALYLAAAGVGELVLVDFDRVELSNLQRQIVHDTTQLGQYKTLSAQATLQARYPDVQIIVINQAIKEEWFKKNLGSVDVVVDCSDNFATRFAINAACVKSGTPLVSGAALRWGGQVTVFLPSQPYSPCYRCLYGDQEEQSEVCSETGVVTPLVGIIGCTQSMEVLKILLNIGKTLCGKVLLFDAYTGALRTLKLHKDPACPICSKNSDIRKIGNPI
ncbi:molybdopterin-synthase adenylyltransferase MoeB [Candidatus Parabeggiatoa sp. HSG14]|uniref:HesA/MoeB/ThiF family protein n=1 Tax=Candidatus Parabeggiatoa sp. HSG14 TaxID=3055593 RepID=UPI0025A772F7|nr:molybdopterin-synthase adenylyltransferase MoeB [Thiotrichales bacterium HSG14]